jgi:hypothetical protein
MLSYQETDVNFPVKTSVLFCFVTKTATIRKFQLSQIFTKLATY